MTIYFLSELSKKGNNAGSKARNDLEKIFENNKFIKINNLPLEGKNGSKNPIYYLKECLKCLKISIHILRIKNAIIFVQYPILKGKILNIVFKIVSKNNKICYYVHDINALRSDISEQEQLLLKEINLLNTAEYVVLHNQKMIDKLKQNGLKSNIINMELFDYLLDKEVIEERKFDKEIVYAGNLKKGTFIDELNEYKQMSFKLNLYGPNFNDKNISNLSIEYKGNYLPNVVPNKLEGSFGLIWDGTTINECNGVMGEYTKYNNPHKLSLYIAAGLPVIVWSKSAISDLVNKYEIGFSIDSIYEIQEKIGQLNEKDYNKYKENIKKLSGQIINGFYSNRVIEEIISDNFNYNNI